MPLYTTITEDGFVSDEKKVKIAKEITRIHTTVMKVPNNFVRVVFLSYPKGSAFAAGEKAEMLQQLWSMFQTITGIPTDQLAISLQEIPSTNAMEMGQIMPSVGHKKEAA